jgi:hypothetical protein
MFGKEEQFGPDIPDASDKKSDDKESVNRLDGRDARGTGALYSS